MQGQQRGVGQTRILVFDKLLLLLCMIPFEPLEFGKLYRRGMREGTVRSSRTTY